MEIAQLWEASAWNEEGMSIASFVIEYRAVRIAA